jgi:hypothetical protein
MPVDPVQQDHILQYPYQFSFGHRWPSEECAKAGALGPKADWQLVGAERSKRALMRNGVGAAIRLRWYESFCYNLIEFSHSVQVQ